VTIKSNDVVENAIVVAAKLVKGKVPPQKSMKGYLQGENFVVPLAVWYNRRHKQKNLMRRDVGQSRCFLSLKLPYDFADEFCKTSGL